MLKDNKNLNLCAQKFSRFVNVLARSYKISVFFPLFFILKVGMNADLHVAVSFSPRLCLPLQRGTPCLSLKREKVEGKRRRRRAGGRQQTSPTSRGIWNSQVKTMLTTAWMSLFCYEQKSTRPPQRGQQLQTVTDECATVAFAGCTNRQCLQKQQRSQRTLQVAFLGFGAAIYSPVINDFYTDASRDEWNMIFWQSDPSLTMSPQFSAQYSATGFGKGGDFILVFDHAEFVTPALGGRQWIWTEWMNLGRFFSFCRCCISRFAISHHIFTDLKQPGQGRLHFLLLRWRHLNFYCLMNWLFH